MGKSVEDGDNYRACADCTRVCQINHGTGLVRSVPRFSRPVPDYALPSANNCNMQIPAFYTREHGPNIRGKCLLVGVTGAQWEVSFKDISFRDGWKVFANDYKLEKGDIIVFSLVAPKKFLVNIFDKFGMEKVCLNEENGEAGRLQENGEAGKENGEAGTLQENGEAGTLQENGEAGKENGEAGKENGEAGKKNGEAGTLQESGEASESSYDSVSVRLAKEVLRKSNQKKELKKRKLSSPEAKGVEEERKMSSPEAKGVEEAARGATGEDLALESELVNQPGLGVEEAARGATGEDLALESELVNQPGLGVEEATRGATGEDLALESELVNQPGLVKQEPDVRGAESYPHLCTNCEHCGGVRIEKTPSKLRELKLEPITSENLEISKATLNVTEHQKMRALKAAKDFLATATNRHAIVVMRVSLEEKTLNCFVSLNCAELLPSENAEVTLLDSNGVSCKVHWNADKRHFQGPGWRDFVSSHNLQLHDVFVLEVPENSEQRFVVLVHIFHAHEMENLPLQRSRGVSSYVKARLGGRAKQKAVRERHSLYSPHVRKKEESMQQQQQQCDGLEKRVRTQNSREVYPIAKMLDRRKGPQGVLFLVELGKPVSQTIIHKRMKCKQDGKGRWWVPHDHFTKDFTSCFIE
ncbi:hypothetical protein KC19_2G120800 [Ceratodon purpureus]|uniref:TF-B3 domain-containing protein n=1 Tax=Ceratodon purpureus TaxID=3225 RepID=A0A8T0IV48_CERPU|nr:hypothetical protein KC19_2G120800 [Ceratodon purpureus]